MKYYLEAFGKYAKFSGRASRKEFWMFFLINSLIIIGLVVIESVFLGNSSPDKSVLASLYNLVTIVPYLALSVRRVHDVGKSGWFVLIPLYNLILFASEGSNDENKFGPVPVVNS
jgi:uncharacterized membrane protein YhaH (DUF805 family)